MGRRRHCHFRRTSLRYCPSALAPAAVLASDLCLHQRSVEIGYIPETIELETTKGADSTLYPYSGGAASCPVYVDFL